MDGRPDSLITELKRKVGLSAQVPAQGSAPCGVQPREGSACIFDESLIAVIDKAADVQNVSRDAAFKEALETWVAHKPTSKAVVHGLLEIGIRSLLHPVRSRSAGPGGFCVGFTGISAGEDTANQGMTMKYLGFVQQISSGREVAL